MISDDIIDETLAHDVAQLIQDALGNSPCVDLPTIIPTLIKETYLGTNNQPQPVLLASYLWDQPSLLHQVITF